MAPLNNDTIETKTLAEQQEQTRQEQLKRDTPAAAASLFDPVKNAFNQRPVIAERKHLKLTGVLPPTTYPPLPILDYDEKALKADPTLKNLLEKASIKHLSPKIGSVLSGIQLHELTDAQKDELALLTSVRGVVFFEGQQLDVDQQVALHRYYGPLHIHQNYAHADGYPEVYLLEVKPEQSEKLRALERSAGITSWHTDVSYERRPPCYTSLRLYTAPEAGADTIWTSSYEAYDRLSPQIKTLVEELTAIHSSKSQAELAVTLGQTVRRPYVEFEHPVVRTHPVTKRKALFVNEEFTTRIPQLTPAESDAVLRFLFAHIANGHEFQVRYHLSDDSVAFWDNRISTHFATFDHLPNYRQGTRVTTQGEIPYFDADTTPII